jgi:hypothetical protein
MGFIDFARWMEHVDEWCWTLGGVSLHDLADQPYLDWYQAGDSPRTAAQRALQADGWSA